MFPARRLRRRYQTGLSLRCSRAGYSTSCESVPRTGAL